MTPIFDTQMLHHGRVNYDAYIEKRASRPSVKQNAAAGWVFLAIVGIVSASGILA